MKRAVVILGVLFLLAAQAHAQQATSKVKGSVSLGNKKLNIVSAAATWNSERKEMRIYLFPFKLTDADLGKVRAGNGWTIASKKQSPDKKLWESWCPYASLRLTFKADNPSLETATFCNFIFSGLKGHNYSVNHNRHGSQVQESIQSLVVKDGRLELKSKGVGEISGAKHSWDYDVYCPVFDIKK